MGFIYKITNKITGKCYVGETVQPDPENRWKRHIQNMKRDIGCPALTAAMKKHGVDNFKFEIIIICFDEDVMRYEKEYIQKYNSIVPNGYNILPGGQIGESRLGTKHTEETKKKISEGLRIYSRNNPNHYESFRGKHQEAIKGINYSSAIRNSQKFKEASERRRLNGDSNERRTKVREGLIRYYSNNEGNTDNIEKHREAMKKAAGKSVVQYNKANVIIAEYGSIAEAARQTDIMKANIQHALSGRANTAGGFIWRYATKVV